MKKRLRRIHNNTPNTLLVAWGKIDHSDKGELVYAHGEGFIKTGSYILMDALESRIGLKPGEKTPMEKLVELGVDITSFKITVKMK